MRLYLLAPAALLLASCVNDTAKIRRAALYTGKSAVAVLADQQEIVKDADRILGAVDSLEPSGANLDQVRPIIRSGAQDVKERAQRSADRVKEVKDMSAEIYERSEKVEDKSGGWWGWLSGILGWSVPGLALIALIFFFPAIMPLLSMLRSFGIGLGSVLKTTAENLVDLVEKDDDEDAKRQIELLEQTPKGRAAIRYAKRRRMHAQEAAKVMNTYGIQDFGDERLSED